MRDNSSGLFLSASMRQTNLDTTNRITIKCLSRVIKKRHAGFPQLVQCPCLVSEVDRLMEQRTVKYIRAFVLAVFVSVSAQPFRLTVREMWYLLALSFPYSLHGVCLLHQGLNVF